MADVAGSARAQTGSRVHSLVVPREHGGWGMLLIPLMTGALAGVPQAHALRDLLLFAVVSLSLFWLRTPLEALMGIGAIRAHTREERRAVLRAIAALLPIATLSGAALVWGGRNQGLFLLAAIAGASLVAQHSLRRLGRKTRAAAQMAGAIGLCSTAAGAFYVVTGVMDKRALALWFACWLFSCDQIHYVHLRIQNARTTGAPDRLSVSGRFLVGQILMLIAVALASLRGFLPSLAILAFLPVFFRAVFWLVEEGENLNVRWLGMTELMQGISFGVLLITTFHVHF